MKMVTSKDELTKDVLKALFSDDKLETSKATTKSDIDVIELGSLEEFLNGSQEDDVSNELQTRIEELEADLSATEQCLEDERKNCLNYKRRLSKVMSGLNLLKDNLFAAADLENDYVSLLMNMNDDGKNNAANNESAKSIGKSAMINIVLGELMKIINEDIDEMSGDND